MNTAQAGVAQGANERESILAILDKTDWNKAKAARLLNISRATLYSKLLKYGIEENPD